MSSWVGGWIVVVVVVDEPQCPARLRQACFGSTRSFRSLSHDIGIHYLNQKTISHPSLDRADRGQVTLPGSQSLDSVFEK